MSQRSHDDHTCPFCGGPTKLVAPSVKLAQHGVSPTFARIVAFLERRAGHYVDWRPIADYVYADDEDGGPEDAKRVLSVLVSTHRPTLEHLTGYTIVGLGGRVGGRRLVKMGVER